MPFPAKLRFRDRRAEHASVAFFDCTRKGHPPGEPRTRKAFKTRHARETFITRHDALFHDRLLASRLGVDIGPALGIACSAFMEHIRDLAARGKRDHKTVRYYAGICEKLTEHFGEDTPLSSIGRKAGIEYAKRRRKAGSVSQGERFIKELKVVRRLQKFMDVNVAWEIPRDDIAPVHEEKEPIGLDDVRDFLRAMKPDSVEYAFATAKLITMLRNEELYAANVGDLRQGESGAELIYRLRNKQTGAKIMRVTFIPERLAALLSSWAAGRKADAPLFHIEGRRLGPSSLRKRFLRASERATKERAAAFEAQRPDSGHSSGATVSITSIGQFRHEGSTIAHDELASIAPISEQLGHTTEATFQRHYKLRQRKKAMAQSRAVTEAVEGKLGG